MPAFMFEKISPPVHRVAQAVTISEPRGVIVQMLDKLTANRLQREARAMQKARKEIGFTEADITPTRTRGS
jgi:hypothetical protein